MVSNGGFKSEQGQEDREPCAKLYKYDTCLVRHILQIRAFHKPTKLAMLA